MKKIKYLEVSYHGGMISYEYYQDFKEHYKEFLSDDFVLCMSPALDRGEIIVACEDKVKNKIKIDDLCNFLLGEE